MASKKDIFINETANSTIELLDANGNPIAVNGSFQVDISGVLDTAQVVTQYLHSNNSTNAWVSIADGTWDGTADPVPVLPDGSIITLGNRFIRFVLQNVSLSTSISLSVSYG